MYSHEYESSYSDKEHQDRQSNARVSETPEILRNFKKVDCYWILHKHAELAVMAILASEALLYENKKIQQWNIIPVSIEPGTLAIQV